MWKKLQVLLYVLNDIAVEKRIIVTIDQKSCKRTLICGSACICSSVFGLFCIYHYSFPGVRQVIAHVYCFFGFDKIQRPNSAIEVLHAQFIWVSSRDSVETNGVQKAFLGTPQKTENCCFFWVWQNSTSEFYDRSSSCAISTAWFFQNFSANHPDSGWLAHIRHYKLSSLPGLLKDIAVEKDENRYDRPKKLQANSHLWVCMHMQFGFWVVLHWPLFFFK